MKCLKFCGNPNCLRSGNDHELRNWHNMHSQLVYGSQHITAMCDSSHYIICRQYCNMPQSSMKSTGLDNNETCL